MRHVTTARQQINKGSSCCLLQILAIVPLPCFCGTIYVESGYNTIAQNAIDNYHLPFGTECTEIRSMTDNQKSLKTVSNETNNECSSKRTKRRQL
eukprot:2740059-Amphidinium_carterae.1